MNGLSEQTANIPTQHLLLTPAAQYIKGVHAQMIGDSFLHIWIKRHSDDLTMKKKGNIR